MLGLPEDAEDESQEILIKVITHLWVKTLQLGGTFPLGSDPDVQVWDCPNPMNRVKVELRRVKSSGVRIQQGPIFRKPFGIG